MFNEEDEKDTDVKNIEVTEELIYKTKLILEQMTQKDTKYSSLEYLMSNLIEYLDDENKNIDNETMNITHSMVLREINADFNKIYYKFL